jgi:hypothetical protein
VRVRVESFSKISAMFRPFSRCCSLLLAAGQLGRLQLRGKAQQKADLGCRHVVEAQ